jgi:17beta-estradiol 17-dehydrogenase / very-long-chain 3-oxoacyl-CoA reductase
MFRFLFAVVTGGSDGIGKAYAQELARRGLNIVLIARNQDKMRKVATEIGSKNSESIHFGYADDFLSAEEEFGIETKIIVADFSKGRTVFDHIEQELKNVDVGILGMQK